MNEERMTIIMGILFIISIMISITLFLSLIDVKTENGELRIISNNLPELNWKHFAIVGDNLEMYIDGESIVESQDGEKTVSFWMECVDRRYFSINEIVDEVITGRYLRGEGYFLNRSLTSVEINELYDSTKLEEKVNDLESELSSLREKMVNLDEESEEEIPEEQEVPVVENPTEINSGASA